MNVERFLRDYARTAENVRGVLAEWEALAPALREHYADELALMLARRVEVLESARARGGSLMVVLRMARRDAQVMAFRSDIVAAMGFDPVEMILSSASTDATVRDTGTIGEDAPLFLTQALAA